jgi:hypothetical protein
MLSNTHKKGIAAGLAVLSTLAFAGTFSSGANADPQQLSALAGSGSDTSQDIGNAFAGFANGINYTPVQASAANGRTQIISFDATPAGTCITTKLNGPSFDRPNGSGEGVGALSRIEDGGLWKRFVPACGASGQDVSGQLDWARSSSGPVAAGGAGTTGAGTPLTYIPFGRDALSFAYYRANGAPATTATRAELNAIFSWNGTGAVPTIGGVPTIGCGIQTGSGTFRTWRDRVSGGSGTTEATATALCNSAVGGARAQENDATALKTRGDAVAAIAGQSNYQVVIGFSASAFIAQSNGKGASTIPTTGWAGRGGIGAISESVTPCNLATTCTNLGSPVIVGAGGVLAPNPTFYAGSNNTAGTFVASPFGRLMFHVVSTAVLGITPALQDIFVGSSSAICQQTQTIQDFGFTLLPSGPTNVAGNCGSTAQTGALLVNPTS